MNLDYFSRATTLPLWMSYPCRYNRASSPPLFPRFGVSFLEGNGKGLPVPRRLFTPKG